MGGEAGDRGAGERRGTTLVSGHHTLKTKPKDHGEDETRRPRGDCDRRDHGVIVDYRICPPVDIGWMRDPSSSIVIGDDPPEDREYRDVPSSTRPRRIQHGPSNDGIVVVSRR